MVASWDLPELNRGFHSEKNIAAFDYQRVNGMFIQIFAGYIIKTISWNQWFPKYLDNEGTVPAMEMGQYLWTHSGMTCIKPSFLEVPAFWPTAKYLGTARDMDDLFSLLQLKQWWETRSGFIGVANKLVHRNAHQVSSISWDMGWYRYFRRVFEVDVLFYFPWTVLLQSQFIRVYPCSLGNRW